jgi:hypothetical protein
MTIDRPDSEASIRDGSANADVEPTDSSEHTSSPPTEVREDKPPDFGPETALMW